MASQTRKIALDTIALFTGKAVGLLLGFIRLNYLATYLGIGQFGVLNFAAYFVSLFQSLFDLGIAQILTREIARNTGESRKLLGGAVLLKAGVGIVSGGIVLLAVAASGMEAATGEAIAWTALAQVINSITMGFLSAFQAHRRMALVSAASVINDLVLSGLVILLLPGTPEIRTVLLLTNAVAFLNLLVLWGTYRHIVGSPLLAVDRPLWSHLVREGFPIAVSAFGVSVYMFIGPTMLKFFRSKEEVGLFSAGYKLISILTLVPTAVSQVVYPVFSEFAGQAAHKLQKALQDSLRVMFELSVPLAVGTILLAPRIMALIYPPDFAEGATVLRLIIAGNALGFLAWILTAFFLAIGRQAYCMWTSLAVAAAVTITDLIVIPIYGFTGAAAVSGMTEIVLWGSFTVLAWKSGFPVRDGATFLRILGAAAVMGCAVSLGSAIPLIPLIIGAAALYGVLLVVFRIPGDQERELIARMLRFGRSRLTGN